MELTIHGKLRIQGRTHLVAKDVISIIEAGAFVNLGSDAKGNFLLFFSPFDHQCKIAIVAKKENALVSIWEKNYVLPVGIKRVTFAREKVAEGKVRAYLFDRLRKNSTAPQEVTIQVEVWVNGKVAHRQLIGVLPKNEAMPDTRWPLLIPLMRSILSVVEGMLATVTGKKEVYYHLYFLIPNSHKPIARHIVTHDRFMDYFKAAST